jgi:acetyl esterase/lipase
MIKMKIIKQSALVLSLALCVFFYKEVALVIDNSRYSLFDFELDFEDRLISLYLSLPQVLPYAQPWVTDTKEGRQQIANDRKVFNNFVNAGHDKQVEAMGLVVTKISVPVGYAAVDVFLYRSKQNEAQNSRKPRSPLFIWIHGGGFVYGEARDSLLMDLKLQCPINITQADGSNYLVNNLVMASVEYRKPPEDKFPVATDDCFAALLWLVDHTSELGVDPLQISVGGTSAGGNLAAVLAHRAFYAGISLRSQFILVPAIYYGCVTQSCLEMSKVWYHFIHDCHIL